jgi:hypothetical protein
MGQCNDWFESIGNILLKITAGGRFSFSAKHTVSKYLRRSVAAWLIGSLFILSMLCLIGALIFVILHINQSLAALKLEMVVES